MEENRNATAEGKKLLPDEEIIELYWSRDERAISATDDKYRKFLLNVAVTRFRQKTAEKRVPSELTVSLEELEDCMSTDPSDEGAENTPPNGAKTRTVRGCVAFYTCFRWFSARCRCPRTSRVRLRRRRQMPPPSPSWSALAACE